jgi:hypothetical protein
MHIIQHQKNGPHNTLERFYIHKEAASYNHLNDDHTIFPNKIFDTILKIQPHKTSSPPNLTAVNNELTPRPHARHSSQTEPKARRTESSPQRMYHDNKTPRFYSSTNVLLPSPITANIETSTAESTTTPRRTRHQPNLEQQTGTPETKNQYTAGNQKYHGQRNQAAEIILGPPSTNCA